MAFGSEGRKEDGQRPNGQKIAPLTHVASVVWRLLPESICVLRKFRFLGLKGSSKEGKRRRARAPGCCICSARMSEQEIDYVKRELRNSRIYTKPASNPIKNKFHPTKTTLTLVRAIPDKIRRVHVRWLNGRRAKLDCRLQFAVQDGCGGQIESGQIAIRKLN